MVRSSRLLIKTSDLRFSLNSLHRGTTKSYQFDESEPQWGASIPTVQSGDFFSGLLEAALGEHLAIGLAFVGLC